MPGAAVWPVLLVSVVLHAVYKLSLAQAYRSAEFSSTYPFARGLVPLFAAGLSYAWLGQSVSAAEIAAIAAIVAGVIGLAWQRASLGLASLLPAALAGLTVAAYSIVDAWGIRLSGNWASFTAWLVVVDSLVFLVAARLVQGPSLWTDCARAPGRIVIASVLGLAAFTVFLWALSWNSAASVIAFRECSVLFGTAIGVFVLKERLTIVKAACVTLIAAGLFAIAIVK